MGSARSLLRPAHSRVPVAALGRDEERLRRVQQVSPSTSPSPVASYLSKLLILLCAYSKGEKITVKAHGGTIDVEGVTVAKVNDKLQLQSVDTWFDPLTMFRQIAPNGIVNQEIVDRKLYPTPEAALDSGDSTEPISTTTTDTPSHLKKDQIDVFLEKPAEEVHPHPREAESKVQPDAGEGVLAPAESEEVIMTHQEMSNVTAAECPFLMNRE